METTVFIRIYKPLAPTQRELQFAGPLSEQLEAAGCGYVIGGGTKLATSGEFEYSFIEVIAEDQKLVKAITKQFFNDLAESIRYAFWLTVNLEMSQSLKGQSSLLTQAVPAPEGIAHPALQNPLFLQCLLRRLSRASHGIATVQHIVPLGAGVHPA